MIFLSFKISLLFKKNSSSADDTNPEEIKKEFLEILKPFGLSEKDEEKSGYDTLMWQVNNLK